MRPLDLLQRVKADHTARYFQQLQALLKAGVGLSYALDSLSEQSTSAALRRASAEMASNIADGRTWSESLKKYPGLFPVLTTAIIRAAEEGGFLERACEILARDAELEYENYQLIKSETWYPKILLFLSTILPLPIQIGPYIRIEQIHQAIVIIALWIIWRVGNYYWPVLPRNTGLRRWVDEKVLKLPIAGKTVRAFAGARFCRFLAMSYGAGLSLPRGVSLAGAACDNFVISQKLREAVPKLQAGEPLAETLIATGQIPRTAMPLLQSGELTGDLETQLLAAARLLEIDAKAALRETIVAMCMLIFIFVGAKIGVQVIEWHWEHRP